MDIDGYIMPRKCTDHLHSKQFFYHQRQNVKCCYCKYPIIVRHSRQLEHTTVEELCDKILSCNIRLNKRHLQTRSAKSVSDLCANIVSRGQYVVQAANKECLCTTAYTSKTIGIDSSLSSVDLRSIIFPRKCFSLPHCYKPRLNFNCSCTQDEKCSPKWDIKEINKTVTSESEVNHVSCQKRISPSEFKMKLDVMKKWFGEFNDDQKNIILKELMTQCGGSQNHMLSITMAPIMHQYCPPNCEDFLSWLPQNLALYILSFLDTVSLSMSAMVCKSWNILASEPCLWQRFCRQPQWQLSRAAEQKQMINYRLPNGRVDWKKAFAERYRLQKNWLKGYCHVRTFHGHTQGVFCVQFDDTRIVSGSSDKTIKVWNIRTNSPWSVMTLVGHSGTVRCLHLEGNRLVSGSSDCTIKVWDLSTQHTWSSIACKVTMIGHIDTVRCLQVDDEKVVSGSYDCSLKIWDIKTGQCKATLRGHEGAVLCLQFDDTKIISGSGDKTIKVWNQIDGLCVLTLCGHQDAVTCLQFDSSKIISGSLDRTIKFWNLNTGHCLSTLDWMKSEGHTGVVRCLQADHWRIVSAGDDKTLKVWSLETGQRFVTLRNHTDGVTCLQFNDGVIVSGSYDQTVKLWDFSVC